MRFRMFILLLLIAAPVTISFDLNCTSKTEAWSIFIDNITYCSVNSLNITSPNETITSVNGVTTPTTYEAVDFYEVVVHYLPKGIGKFFPQLRGLYVGSTGLKSINAADLEGLSNLESLFIQHNTIPELSSDLFKFTPKINDLFFANNQISRVGKDLLSNFHSFNRFEFGYNKCIEIHESSDIESRKAELQTKCTDSSEKQSSEDSKNPENEIMKEIEELKSQKSSMEEVISDMKTEIERLKRTCYHGLLDSSTQLLHKVTKQLKECRTARTTEEKVEKGVDVVLTVTSVTENATILDMNIESPESKITKLKDATGNDVQPNQTDIVVDQQNALFLPVNLGQFFKPCRQLSVTFSGLYGLDTRTFIGMQNLVAINFTGNKLVEISDSAFEELADLKELDLSHNNIEVMDDKAFEHNVHLEIVRLSHNQLTAITNPIFKHQTKLRMLLLNDNKLKFISAMLLSTFKAVEVVDLRNNKCIDLSLPHITLEGIEARIIDKCIAPVELNCKHQIQENQIGERFCQAETLELIYPGTMLSVKMAENGSKVKKLSIIDQKMLFMPSQLSKALPNLIQFVVEKSQLTALYKKDFEGLTSLNEITIERNNISLIEEGVFDEVPQITHLYLGYNCIKSLPPKAFVKLTKLKTLDLSENKLKTFTTSLMPRRNVIEDFQLQANQLEYIESKVFKLLRNAELIDLSGNACIDIKYQKSDAKGTTLKEILGHMDLECSNSEEHS